jgi:hypothetical protein
VAVPEVPVIRYEDPVVPVGERRKCRVSSPVTLREAGRS